MTWDPWHLVLVRTAEGTTVPVRVWLPPLPGAPEVGTDPGARRPTEHQGAGEAATYRRCSSG